MTEPDKDDAERWQHIAEERAGDAFRKASKEDRARSDKTVAELVEEDRADPATPEDFDVPLTPYQPPERRPRGDGTLRLGGSDHLMRGDDR